MLTIERLSVHTERPDPEPEAVTEKLRHIRFEEFEDEQSLREIRDIMAGCGLPLDNIQKVIRRRKPGPEDDGITFSEPAGVWSGEYCRQERILFLYGTSSEFLHASREQRVRHLVHEIAHSRSPFWRRDNDDRPVRIKKGRNVEFVQAVARQSLKTRIFFDHYHKFRRPSLLSNSFNSFAEETWAILVEKRYLDPEQLRQVDAEQKRLMQQKGKPYTPLITPAGSSKAEGIDRILIEQLGLEPDDLIGLEERLAEFRSAHIDTK